MSLSDRCWLVVSAFVFVRQRPSRLADDTNCNIARLTPSFTLDPKFYPCNPSGYAPTAQSGGTTNGVFWDLQFWGITGACPGLPSFSGSLRLKFFVSLNSGGSVYNLTTVRNITASKNSSGDYSISATTTTP